MKYASMEDCKSIDFANWELKSSGLRLDGSSYWQQGKAYYFLTTFSYLT